MEINEPYLEGSKIRFEEETDLFKTAVKLNGTTQKV
jgi:hypothetical protein